MTEDEVKQKVITIIEDSTGNIEELTLSSTAEDLGLDSLDIYEIVMDLEEEFKMEIYEEEIEFQNIKTVEDLIKFIPLHNVENKLDRR
jgi:acyl carrier protein